MDPLDFHPISYSSQKDQVSCFPRGRGAAVATLLAARAKLEKQDAQGRVYLQDHPISTKMSWKPKLPTVCEMQAQNDEN